MDWHPVWQRARFAVRATLSAIFGPATIVTLLVLAGGASAVAGVYLLAGTGWALIATSAVLFLLAIALARGMKNG